LVFVLIEQTRVGKGTGKALELGEQLFAGCQAGGKATGQGKEAATVEQTGTSGLTGNGTTARQHTQV
jgi:hypothetical protein